MQFLVRGYLKEHFFLGGNQTIEIYGHFPGDFPKFHKCMKFGLVILLMEEILHHLGCKKPCESYDKLPINWLPGFLPSTV